MSGVRIFLSHPLQSLADRWIADVGESIEHTDLFDPVRVIVPNRNIKRWLQMYMARKGIVAAHIRFLYVEDGIRSLLDGIATERLPLLLRPLDLRGRILALLQKDLSSGESRWPLLTQQTNPSMRAGAGTSIRLFQLAQRLADLFVNYEFHRLRSVEKWRGVDAEQSLDVFGDSQFVEDLESDPYFKEQCELYRAVLAGESAEDSDFTSSVFEYERITPSEYARRVFQSAEKRERSASVYLFGLSLLSRYHISLFRHLSAYYDLSVYLPDLVPGLFAEGEGSVSGEWERVALRSEFRPEPNELLRWKKPYIELVRLWDAAFADSAAWFRRRWDRAYPMKSVHEALMNDTAGGPSNRILVGNCPGERREIETVYQCILQSMKEDPTLELTDIALLVPDMEKYRPYILDVFERDRNAADRPLIPYNLSDYSAARESHYARGVRDLLNLMRRELTRSAIFELALNPCFQHAVGVDRETVSTWLGLFQDTNIRRFYDAEERSDVVGTPPSSERADAFTFLRGLRRLYLGLFVEPEAAPFDGLRPHPLQLVDRESLLKLIQCIERLNVWRQELGQELTGTQRFEKTFQCIDEFIGIPDSEPEEQIVRDRMKSELRLYDKRLFVDWDLLQQAILSALSGIAGSRGHYLAGGVTICSLQPMRPVPFRHIYVAGLGEAQFPLHEDHSVLNLLARDKTCSSSNLPHSDIAAGEKARLLLYETLLSATDRIVLLYNGRDTTRDRDLLPCSLLSELISFLDMGDSVEELPLKLYSRRYAGRNSDLFANLSSRDIRLLNQSVTPKPNVNPAPPPDSRRIDLPATVDLPISHLISFLKHPVEAVLRRQMRLFDSDRDDERLNDDEPFHVTNEEVWDFSSLFFERALQHLVHGVEEATEHAIASLRKEYMDELPVPPYDEVALEQYRSSVFSELLQNAEPILREHRFSSLQLTGDDAVTVRLNDTVVRLVGEIPGISFREGHITILQISEKGFDSRRILPALLYLLVLNRSPEYAWKSFTIHALFHKEKGVDSRTFVHNPDCVIPPHYLEGLVGAFLARDITYLPIGLPTIGKAIWKAGYFTQEPPPDFSEALADEAADTEADFMELMQLIPRRIDSDVFDRLRERWQPIVELAIPVTAPRTRSTKSAKKAGRKA